MTPNRHHIIIIYRSFFIIRGCCIKKFTVSFFGHREIENGFEVEQRLEKIITDLIRSKEYVEFLVGRDGEFDLLASSVIKRCIKKYGRDNTSFVLVLPYIRADYRDNEAGFLDYYDEVEICEEAACAHYKAAIQIRNRCMINRSELVVCCVQRNKGGAYAAMRYAEKIGCKVWNIGNKIE